MLLKLIALALSSAAVTNAQDSVDTCFDTDDCLGSSCDYWSFAYGCDTLEDYGCDCSDCTCSDALSDSWLDSVPDETVGIYGFVGGGYKNSVTGSFGTVAGGYSNQALANYATVGGGFMNEGFARFSSLPGGARNTARGRFSLAIGQYGDARDDFTSSFSFNGESCPTRKENQMAFCADSIKFNDYDLLDLFARRRLTDTSSHENLYEVIANQQQIIAAQKDRLKAIEEELIIRGL